MKQKPTIDQLKYKLEYLFSGEFADNSDLEKLLSSEFCEENFGLEQPVLSKTIDDKAENKNYKQISILGNSYCINIPSLNADAIKKLLDWAYIGLEEYIDIKTSQIEKKATPVKIYVAYSWFKGADVLKDPFWISIRNYINPTLERINKNFSEDKIAIGLSRLRSSHGNFIHNQIFNRIKDADLIIFDLAQSPTLNDLKKQNKNIGESGKCNIKYSGFNSNVLYELGIALGMGKETLVLCPKNLKDKIPSDLSNYMFSLYETKLKKADDENEIYKNITRHFEDSRGLKVYINNKLNSLAKNLKIQLEQK